VPRARGEGVESSKRWRRTRGPAEGPSVGAARKAACHQAWHRGGCHTGARLQQGSLCAPGSRGKVPSCRQARPAQRLAPCVWLAVRSRGAFGLLAAHNPSFQRTAFGVR
jgi:hypothetical protein